MKKYYKEKLLNHLFPNQVAKPVSHEELQALFSDFKIEIEFNLKKTKSSFKKYKYLREMQYEFNEVLEYQKTIDFEDYLEPDEKKRRTPKNEKCQIRPKIAFFPIINNLIISYIICQIDLVNASKSFNAISKPTFFNNLFWLASKKKLVELSSMLVDSQTVICRNSEITLTYLVKALSELFNIEIADIHHKTPRFRNDKNIYVMTWCQICTNYQQNKTENADFRAIPVNISVN